MAKLHQILSFAVKQKASDIALMAGSPPFLRLHGEFTPLQMPALGQNAVKHLLAELLTKEQSEKLQTETNIDLAYSIPDVARFRINCFMHRQGFGIVARIIPLQVPALENLGLPESIVNLLDIPNGIIFVTGPSGSGKTTTQSAIISKIATLRKDHILTIEDPIEFEIKSQSSLVNQRELITHTESYKNALKAALREDPDIILIGEMRDRETIGLAMTAAETGHLVVGTMNTMNATATINRVVDSFPGDQKGQIRLMLSGSLRSIISQKLIPGQSGTRVLATELLINTSNIANLIRDGRTFMIKNAMLTGKSKGMVTMDESLFRLVKEGKTSPQAAIEACENPTELKNKLGIK